MMVCQSCKKGADLFRGEYSYKTTGTLYLGEIGSVDISESGQLRVSKTGGDRVVFMFQPIIGDIFYMNGTAQNDSVFVESDYITQKYTLLGTEYTLTYKITGKGCMHDETILLKSNISGKISGETVTMATRNK